MTEKVLIFDTTLRDGEQAPGCSMNIKEKLKLAHQLARLGVDIIEAGFPISSVGDFEAVKAVAEQVEGAIICGLARAKEEDVVRCGEAIKPAKRGRIHIFIATSDIHREKKLRMSKEEIIKAAVKAVKLARTFTDDVEFSCEDAGRTDWDYICDVVTATIEAGATTINIPDTVGYCTPWQFGECIRYVKERVKNIDKAIISVHCHNDLGLAVANSLAGIAAGARQAECTINGLGERAGNASLEEIVMNLKVRHDFYKCDTNINTQEIYRTSRLVSQITGMTVQRNKAVVGGNAFAHEAGIHQDGVLKEPTTYEIMTADSVGWTGESIVMGKHSGRHGFKKRLEELGFGLTDEEINRTFERFKNLCDKKKEVFDEDLYAIVDDEILTAKPIYQIEYLHTTSGTGTIPTATVRIRKGDEVFQEAGNGDGPIDAAYNAIRRIVGLDIKLEEYGIEAATSGEDAVGRVRVKISHGDRAAIGRAAGTDIILASANAYVNALNKLLQEGEVLAKKTGM